MKTWCFALCVLFAGMVNVLAEDKPVTRNDVAPGKVVVCIPPVDFKGPDTCTLYEKGKCPWATLVEDGKAFTVYTHPDDFDEISVEASKDYGAKIKAKGGNMTPIRERMGGKVVMAYITVDFPAKKE